MVPAETEHQGRHVISIGIVWVHLCRSNVVQCGFIRAVGLQHEVSDTTTALTNREEHAAERKGLRTVPTGQLALG